MQTVKKVWKKFKKIVKHHYFKDFLWALGSFILISVGLLAFWVATLKIPNLESFDPTKISQSTKIYDRTGTVLLYDLHQDQKRSVVPGDQISVNIKNATVAIEDEHFYEHGGVDPTSIMRAIISNISSGCLTCGQGGSTLTQQVVKNTLLTTERSFSRKIKEWVLAYKLDKSMSKDDILSLYLNESPYGGNIYGVEEASQSYFATSSASVDISQAAYLASMLKGPTYYSPYGNHKDALVTRHNLVLKKMLDNKFITQDQYNTAIAEKVVFADQEKKGIKAPHFVNYIIDQLETKYGVDEVEGSGLKVITTLNYDLEQKAEDLVKKFALSNEKTFNASNAALTALDPKTGQILVMVGSRDYFDTAIDGNFNIITTHRQPGSSFKPIVYATAFEKGYQPETVLFDVKTEFSTTCNPDGTPISANSNCYSPVDFDGVFDGPMSLREALAQSRNIPAIKLLYLAGIKDSISTAKAMGITSLSTPDQYGLTLVLGGGEVSPLELTGVYATFADDGIHNPTTGILSVTDPQGKVLEQYTPNPTQAIDKQAALKISSILSDKVARGPDANSFFEYPGHDVAAKTGTTNDFRDAWVMGFTPDIAVGVWTGNNDNSPMVKKVAGYIAAPLWGAFMTQAIQAFPNDKFDQPDPVDLSALKPILRGEWQGDTTYVIDSSSGKLATDLTPPELRQEKAIGTVHSILQYVDKSDPLGPPPADPTQDPQYSHWEYGVRNWVAANHIQEGGTAPTATDDVHTPTNAPIIQINNPIAGATYAPNSRIIVSINHQNHFPLQKVDYFLNGTFLGSATNDPFTFSFSGNDPAAESQNTLRAVGYDNVMNQGSSTVDFLIGQ